MEFLFVCKAGTEIGLGHLIRSKTLAEGLFELNPDCKFSFYIIGDIFITNLLQNFSLPYQLYKSEDHISFNKKYQVVIIDTLVLKK
jgi:spore coat polysaccharide biosynthesis predicted glycosyltransferase SpsG